MRRGLTYAQAIDYVGVKRRTFDTDWRPHLVEMPQGSSVIFDREDLDRLFEAKKAQAAGLSAAANDGRPEQNGLRNGRPTSEKGRKPWAKRHGESIPKEAPGRSTSGGAVTDFASAVSQVMPKRKAG
jgi:hypothetical protein